MKKFCWVWNDWNISVQIWWLLAKYWKVKRGLYTLIEICAQYWKTYNDCLQFNGKWRFVTIRKIWRQRKYSYLQSLHEQTYIAIFPRYKKYSSVWASLSLLPLLRIVLLIFWLAFFGSFRFYLFWLHLLPIWALFVLLIVMASFITGWNMNNLWVTMIKVVGTIWRIIVTYERHEQSYLSQNGFRQFLVPSQNVWQLQHNYRTKE